MPQYIKPAISGLNTDHALYDDIQAFLEFGQLDKELVGDTALTTTAALVDDTDIGDARTFDATADAVAETVTITGDCTILVIARMIGSHSIGSNGNVFFALGGTGGDFVYLMYDDFSPYKFQSGNRANYTPGATLRTNGDGLDATAHAQGHTIAATLDLNGTNKLCRDGVIATETSSMTGTAYAASPILSFMSSIGSSASVNVGAIVVFDRALSDAELQSVTSDPWALTAEANSDPVLDTPQDDLTIQEGQTGTINAGANFSDANAGDTLTFSDDLNIGAETGFGFNTTTGVITYEGTQVEGVYPVEITASDGNGGTYPPDSFTITVTAPALSIDSIDVTAPVEGSQVVLSVSNRAAPVTASCSAGSLQIIYQDHSVVILRVPKPYLFGDLSLNYNETITITLDDGTNTATEDITIQPLSSSTYGTIGTPNVNGIYSNDGTVTGLDVYAHSFEGDVTLDPITGLIMQGLTGGSFVYGLYDGNWSTVFAPVNIAANYTQLTSQSIDLNNWVAGSGGFIRGNDKEGLL